MDAKYSKQSKSVLNLSKKSTILFPLNDSINLFYFKKDKKIFLHLYKFISESESLNFQNIIETIDETITCKIFISQHKIINFFKELYYHKFKFLTITENYNLNFSIKFLIAESFFINTLIFFQKELF